MGKVIDTAGRKIADTGLALATSAVPEEPTQPARPAAPLQIAAGIVAGAAMIGGFGLLYAQNAQIGSRVEVRMAREEQLDQRFDALTTKLDAVATRLQAVGNRVEGLGSQVSASVRDANKSLSETMNGSLNALSQRLTQQQQQQQQQREQREQKQSSPPPSTNNSSPYSNAPGAIRPRRTFPY